MLGFLRALGGAHGKKAIQEVTDAIVNLDPSTASDAQLAMMEQNLDKVGVMLAKVKTDAAREETEAVAAKAKFDRFAQGAQVLNAKYEAAPEGPQKAALATSLNGLLNTLEEAKVEMDREVSEAADAKALVTETETIYREKAEALRTAQKNLTQGARELARAKLAEEQAQMRANQAAEVAGLRNNEPDGLNSALTSMKRQTDAARGNAEALKIKATVLTQVEDGSLEDPNVLAALAEVKGTSSSLPFSQRLAALGAPAPATAAPLQIGTTSNA